MSRVLRFILPLFFCILALLAVASPTQIGVAQSSGGATLILTGATVIDGLGNPPMADATLVIQGDQIRSVRRGSPAAEAPDATVVDLKGKFVIPGLIDSHVHWGTYMGELYINHGVTSVLAQLDVPEAERADSRTSLSTPRIFHTAGRLEIPADMDAGRAAQVIEQWKKKEPDIAWLADYRGRNRDTYRRTVEAAHTAGFLVFSHAQNAPEAIDLGLDVAEHIWGFAQAVMSGEELKGFQQGRFPTWAAFMDDWTRLDRLIADAVRRGVYLNPTLVYEWGGLSPSTGRREQEAYRLLSNPALAYFPQNLAGSLLMHHRQIKNFSERYEHMPMVSRLAPDDLALFREGYANVQEFIRRWVRAGGKIISGTDAGTVQIPGLGMHHEMELLVEAGLTPMQALQASTSWPAEILSGRSGALGDRRVGSIREGSLADLIVLSANPLDDITHTMNIEHVMKGGRFIQLGYHPDYYTFPVPVRAPLLSTPAPEISAITPNSVLEGGAAFEIVIQGVGFVGASVVRADGVAVPTRFDGPRRLRATISAGAIEKAGPDRFGSPGPEQNVAVFGDRTVQISVFNPTPEGGMSGNVSLIVLAKWRKAETGG